MNNYKNKRFIKSRKSFLKKCSQVKKVTILSLLFSSLLLNQVDASSTYSIAKANRIGTTYASLIKEKITNYNNFSSDFLCSTIILEDLKIHDNSNKYLLSNYLITHYDEDFTLRTYKNCVVTLDLLKKAEFQKIKNSL